MRSVGFAVEQGRGTSKTATVRIGAILYKRLYYSANYLSAFRVKRS